MAEAIGATSGVLTLTIFAFKASKSLFEAVSSFKSQRKNIQDIQTDIGALVTVLDLVRQQVQDSENESKFESLREPVGYCAKTCQEMHEMLNACIKHAKDGHDSLRDWLSMRYQEKSFDDYKQRLASYKSTLSVTFASISIQGHITTQNQLDELKGSIEGTKYDLEDQLDRVGQAISSVEASVRDQLLADQAQLQSCLDHLAQAQRVADKTHPQVVIDGNRGGENSRTLFGTDTFQPRFSLTVSNNEAQRGARMAAGVHSPETLQALLNGSPAADLMSVLHALQTQSQNINTDTLQSLANRSIIGYSQGAIDRPPMTGTAPGLRNTSQEEDAARNVEMLLSRDAQER